MTLEPFNLWNDRTSREEVRKLREAGTPVVPWRITAALGDAEGPEVDIACGAVEPAVDRWETGEETPTDAQVDLLAAFTGYAPAWFYRPAPKDLATNAFVCVTDGPGKGCYRLDEAGQPVGEPYVHLDSHAEQPQLFGDPVEQLGLFDEPERTAAVPAGEMSPDRLRTMRQKATIARGRHPLTGGLAFPGASCGTCPHMTRRGRYLKCGLGPTTNGPATDIRASWPACIRHPAAQQGLEDR